MNFFFFGKCDQIRRKLEICWHLLQKSLMENLFFCTVMVMFLIHPLEPKKEQFLWKFKVSYSTVPEMGKMCQKNWPKLSSFLSLYKVFNGHDSYTSFSNLLRCMFPERFKSFGPHLQIIAHEKCSKTSHNIQQKAVLTFLNPGIEWIKWVRSELKKSFCHNAQLFDAFLGRCFNIFHIFLKAGSVRLVNGDWENVELS